MALVVPLVPVAAQVLVAQLGGQQCTLTVRQRSTGMYIDLAVAGAAVVAGVICQNLNRIVRSLYLGFQGDLVFVDTQGDGDPVYTGLGSRWFLVYLFPAEVPPLPFTMG